MKRLKISLTVVVEVTLIYLFSSLVGWSFMEAFFLGSLAIFGAIWLVALNISQNNNIDHTIYKTGTVKPFQMTWGPYTTGAASLTAFSFIITTIYYLPYFL
ncbi:hypothetical protein P4U05_27600 [Bacillus paranthracis]|uniref:hypothetical protein n=1 Tax=Bacillus TaxID=1386 RepID=UPI000200F995|nr:MULTISPECIES: hypothetical protein [Bacillus]ADY23370.1 hypothetical protein YBT020_20710 [Bacillus thuringiensis serovar finitimus YBT-020]AFQ10739.1 hypothetical protein BCK_14205 [Bacillus cereus FRI-35]MCW4574730.1 hypothetical protein [Bacillus pacificus]MRC73225.1 hypothetical protein [Bacillus thuringiensis]OTX77923.1 hypothetical protein BK722_00330 [Bacillus thuringiensis serovar finitimus]HDR3648016.1 hypothetical protein [Bacillus anthracis]